MEISRQDSWCSQEDQTSIGPSFILITIFITVDDIADEITSGICLSAGDYATGFITVFLLGITAVDITVLENKCTWL